MCKRTRQSKAMCKRTRQSKTMCKRTGQSKTMCKRTGQSKTMCNLTSQSKTMPTNIAAPCVIGFFSTLLSTVHGKFVYVFLCLWL